MFHCSRPKGFQFYRVLPSLASLVTHSGPDAPTFYLRRKTSSAHPRTRCGARYCCPQHFSAQVVTMAQLLGLTRSDSFIAYQPLYTNMLGDIKDSRLAEEDEISSHASSALGLEDGGARKEWTQPTPRRSWRSRFSLGGRELRLNGESESQRIARRREHWRWFGIVVIVLTMLGIIAGG